MTSCSASPRLDEGPWRRDARRKKRSPNDAPLPFLNKRSPLKECSGCGRWKASVCFARNSRDVSGLQPWCKHCHRRYNFEKPKVKIPTVMEKRCSTCRCLKPMQAFNKDVSKPTGLRSQCNTCRSNRRHAQRQKARPRTQPAPPSQPSPVQAVEIPRDSASGATSREMEGAEEDEIVERRCERPCSVSHAVAHGLAALPKSERLLAALLAAADYANAPSELTDEPSVM